MGVQTHFPIMGQEEVTNMKDIIVAITEPQLLPKPMKIVTLDGIRPIIIPQRKYRLLLTHRSLNHTRYQARMM